MIPSAGFPKFFFHPPTRFFKKIHKNFFALSCYKPHYSDRGPEDSLYKLSITIQHNSKCKFQNLGYFSSYNSCTTK